MKLPPVFLHRRWSWLFWPHLELCWLNVLIGIIRAFHEGQSYFALWFSVTISNLWFLFDLPLLNEGDGECEKKPCQYASCKLKDEEEVKNEKERRKEKKRRRKAGRAEVERSNFSDRTNYRNLQEPVSAKNISSPSHILSPPLPWHAVSFAFRPSFIFLFSFFRFILRSRWGYYWWGT